MAAVILIRGGFGGGGAAGGGFTGGGRGGGGLLGRFGGIGGIAKGAAGLAGGALVAGGGAALAYGAGRVLAGHQKYQAGIGQRIQLRGLGQNPAIQDSQRAAAAGLDQGELRGRRIQDIRALGSAAGGESGTLKRAEYERSFGLEGGTLSGLAGQTKGAVGGKAAAADIQKTLESAVSAGLQDADIGSYLETAVGLLQNIDSSGIKDRSAMLQALSDVTRATKDSPEQIARGLGNIDSAISGSSGEANAFFQQAFAGQGGGTIGGAQFATEGGLAGLDLRQSSWLIGSPKRTVRWYRRRRITEKSWFNTKTIQSPGNRCRAIAFRKSLYGRANCGWKVCKTTIWYKDISRGTGTTWSII